MKVPKIRVASGNPFEKDMPLLAIAVSTEDAQDPNSVLAEMMREKFRLTIIANWGREFSGKPGEQLVLTPAPRERLEDACFYDSVPCRILLVGLGPKDEVTAEKFRRAGGIVGQYAKEHKISWVSLYLQPEDEWNVFAEGVALALYEYTHKDKDTPVSDIELFLPEEHIPFTEALLSDTSALIAAKYRARDWGNTPANLLTPAQFANDAHLLALHLGLKGCRYDRGWMEDHRMGALLAVARGSREEPRFCHFWYTPKDYDPAKGRLRKVVLIGKGVTFDAGGISLKPGLKMDEMKYDMCGGAAVFASMITVAQMQPNCEVHFVVPMTENLPDGNAVKPGDVVTAMDGQTIEVLNTDAEGRLILADALCYVKKEIKPDGPNDIVFVCATLTGAVIVALGHDKTALYSNNDALAQEILATEAVTGEGLWRMPLIPEIAEDFKSKFADMANIGKPGEGGSIGGGIFLQKFVPENWNWAYCDIAGTAWGARASVSYNVTGATGVMVGTFTEIVRSAQE